MNQDQLKQIKELEDLVNDIKEITKQQNNPSRSGMEQVIINVKNKHIEVATYESTSAFMSGGVTTNISYITDDVLYSKLQPYKIILLTKIMNKYGIEEYKKIVNENKLEV